MLDSLLGTLAFDPLAFSKAKPEEQFETLKAFVKDLDIAAEEQANRTDYEARTGVNRDAKAKRAAAGQIVVPDDAPETEVSVGELMRSLADTEQRNAEIGEEKQRRAGLLEWVRIQEQQAETNRRGAADLRAQAEELEKSAEEADRAAAERRAEVEALEPLDEPTPTEPIRENIAGAEERNAAVRKRVERDNLITAAEELEARSAELTTAMDGRTTKIQEAIAKADMPVEGLSLAAGEVFLNGVPLAQASDADQLRLSCGIAMRQHSKLRVIRVRDGSLLDENSMAILREMADDNDFQVWIERVDTSGTVGFVIEDGAVKGADSEAPEGEGETDTGQLPLAEQGENQ